MRDLGFGGTLARLVRGAAPDVGSMAPASGTSSLAAAVPEVPGSPFSRFTSGKGTGGGSALNKESGSVVRWISNWKTAEPGFGGGDAVGLDGLSELAPAAAAIACATAKTAQTSACVANAITFRSSRPRCAATPNSNWPADWIEPSPTVNRKPHRGVARVAQVGGAGCQPAKN